MGCARRLLRLDLFDKGLVPVGGLTEPGLYHQRRGHMELCVIEPRIITEDFEPEPEVLGPVKGLILELGPQLLERGLHQPRHISIKRVVFLVHTMSLGPLAPRG